MWRRISAVVIPLIIMIAIFAAMLVRVQDELLLALKTAETAYLIVATGICIAAWLLRGVRYRSILSGLGLHSSVSLSTACIFISQTANLLVPARLGDLVRLFILKHEIEAPYSRGFSSVIVERFYDIITVALLGVIALPFMVDAPEWFYTLIIVPLAAGAALFIVILKIGGIRTENRYVTIVIGLLEDVRDASMNAPALLSLGISSFIIWLVDVAVCAVVAIMFGQTIPISALVLAIVIGNLVKAVPITPGGLGTYELAVALTLELAGTAAPVATLIAVIDHLIKNLVTLGGGAISIFAFGDWAVSIMRRALNRTLTKEELM
jgi:uncharacterized membrane protein YbhN (UPF0104 family)